MSQEDINLAIALCLGWRPEVRKRYGGADNVRGWGFNTNLSRGHPYRQFITHPCMLPNYCSDLNAMHEAEKWIVDGQDKELRSRWFIKMQQIGTCAGTHATAIQRAEVFLRAHRKWKESK